MEMSEHSTWRAAQRSLGDGELDYVLSFGTCFHRGGAEIVFLRDKDLPYADRRDPALVRLVGTAVILSTDRETVITVWRNRKQGLKRIRKKGENTLY